MAGPESISAKQIAAAAKTSVTKALDKHGAKFPRPKYEIGFVPPWWWIGIIIRNPEVEQATLGDARKLASDIQRDIAGAVPAVTGGKAGAVIQDGFITVGFLPPKEILIQE